jgi:hypothetical protein
MNNRRFWYCLIVTAFVTIAMFTSVYAADFSHTFFLRGNGNNQTSSHQITGKICSMVDNTFYMEIDMGTTNRYIVVSMAYMVPAWWGGYRLADSVNIINNEYWGNPGYYGDATVSRQMNNIAFVWASYGTGDQGYISLIASGANSAYAFRIYNAEFNFSNY